MSVTIGSLTLNRLQAQPLSYTEEDTITGATAKAWVISGLLTGAEWLSLLSIYDTWRDAKIAEVSPEISKVMGATVSFSGTGFGGQTWTNVPCWFEAAPVGSVTGAYIAVEFRLVSAQQLLQIYLKTQSDTEAEESTIDYGTITVGGVSIKLTAFPETVVSSPSIELTAGGKHYLTGPSVVVMGKSIEGEILGSQATTLLNWCTTTANTLPSAGSYYPISMPEFTGFTRVVSGAPVLYYSVTMTLAIVV